MRYVSVLSLLPVIMAAVDLSADEPQVPDTSHGDALLNESFERQVSEIEASTFAGIETLDDWQAKRGEYRRQLAEMLGLDPLPEKTPLQPVVTGTREHPDARDPDSTTSHAGDSNQRSQTERAGTRGFTVETLHFQSLPGLYVTGNLYVPKGLEKPAPTVLYVCGHARAKEGDVSFGNKTAYQHHAIWFARHGYVCLIIDTLQLGEIEGTHHGTYRKGMWWWQSRGYTPAGVEAWNGIRALDYLETRPEVDATRFGVTGRSGGGAYSWWIAALDERIKVAVPVAGICSLRNHLLGPFQTSPWSRGETHGHDGCIEGHCDCMYFVNTYRWDFPLVAALVAPRPLLIANTDKDRIFPLDGVYDVYQKTQQIYALYDATDKLGLQICEGPHKDTQQLRVPAFQWMNKFLKGEERLIDIPAEKLFEPQDLRVFDELPDDQINTTIHDTFVPAAAEPPVPETQEQWQTLRDAWMASLRKFVLRGWPGDSEAPPLDVERTFSSEHDGLWLSVYEFTSQEPYRLQMLVQTAAGRDPAHNDNVIVSVIGEEEWPQRAGRIRGWFPDFMAESNIAPLPASDDDRRKIKDGLPQNLALVTLLPRGVGPTAWTGDEKERIHIQRRFALLGQTLDGMRAWDVHRGLRAVQELTGDRDLQIQARASGQGAGWLLTASLFNHSISDLRLDNLNPVDSPMILLNARRHLPPAALPILAAEHAELRITTDDPEEWEYARRMTNSPWFHEQILIDEMVSESQH